MVQRTIALEWSGTEEAKNETSRDSLEDAVLLVVAQNSRASAAKRHRA